MIRLGLRGFLYAMVKTFEILKCILSLSLGCRVFSFSVIEWCSYEFEMISEPIYSEVEYI